MSEPLQKIAAGLGIFQNKARYKVSEEMVEKLPCKLQNENDI